MPCPFCPGGGFGFGGGLGFLVSLLFLLMILAGIGLLVWWIVRHASTGRYTPGGRMPTSRAVEILDERYAKGEISKEEYEERRRTLLAG